MSTTTTTTKNTAILLVDTYKEFLDPSGKLYPRVAPSLQATDTIQNLHDVIATARSHHIPIFYCLHQQVTPTTYDKWLHASGPQKNGNREGMFLQGSPGVEIYPGMEPGDGDVVVSKHWSWSSFENTDLEYQLRQRDITRLVFAGMEASACIESTGRVAFERGFYITMLTDATAAFTQEAVDASQKFVWPMFANEVVTVKQWKETLGASSVIGS